MRGQPMMTPDLVSQMVGEWTGTNRLWLSPDDPVRESEGRATVERIAQGQFLTVRYSWSYEGGAQDGLLLVALENPDLPAVWTDSWHMARNLMMCSVDDTAADELSVSGTYAAPTGPDWGWRIAVRPESGGFALRMYNIPPGVGEVPAVEAIYKRVAS
jgi:hypothetical protein